MFTVIIDQFNASLFNKSISFLIFFYCMLNKMFSYTFN